jgi:hypothetical protein
VEDITWSDGYHLSLAATVFAGLNILVFIIAYGLYLWNPDTWSSTSTSTSSFGLKNITKHRKNK